MQILGIETSCDETAAAVVEEIDDPARPWLLRSNVVASQAEIHREWGGVVPEIASRQHVRDICGVVETALDVAGTTLDDIGAIAVTQGPGLVGSLLVGVSFAKSLAVSRGVALVPVHHLAGHIESLFLHHGPLPLPAVVLVVSGGHTSLYVVPEPGGTARSAGPGTMRRGRRTIRWPSCWGWGIPAARRSIARRAAGTIARSTFRRCESRMPTGGRPTLLAGLISASAASRPPCCALCGPGTSLGRTARPGPRGRSHATTRKSPT